MPSRPRRRTDPARRAAFDVLRAVADRDAYANLLLPSLLAGRGITGRDAAFATELTYGTLRGRGTYDAILAVCSDRDDVDPPVRDVLRLGTHQLLATRTGGHAAVATSVDLTKDVCGPRPSGFVNAVLRRVATRDLESWIAIVAPDRAADEAGHLAVRHSYPRWIAEAFHDALGARSAAGAESFGEVEEALAAGNTRPEVTLAILERGSAPVALPDGAQRTRWSPFGVRLAAGDPAALIATGYAAAQDEASQLAALALASAPLAGTAPSGAAQPDSAAQRGEADRRWLDLCAGPGGKARLLGYLAAARGARLVAAEFRPHRAARVRNTLDRSPVPRPAAGVVVADSRRAAWRPGAFDRVLADVPCSGLGSLRRRPEARWRKTPSGIPELAELQRQLLHSAIESVRPGGVVGYVTCSPHVAETHDVVTTVVGERSDITVLDAPAILNDALLDAEIPGLPTPRDKRFAQFWPHRHGTDAIFLALLTRRGEVSSRTPLIGRG
jgi:16S rRNA (cytosine967-C5)-methyltransferase